MRRSKATAGPSSALRQEAVSGAADGLDEVVVAAGLEGVAKAPDMDVHRAVLDEDVVAPDVVQDLRASVDAVGMGHEEMEQVELGGPHFERFSIALGFSRRRVKDQPLDLDRFLRQLRRAPAQDRLDARLELARREG